MFLIEKVTTKNAHNKADYNYVNLITKTADA